MDEKSAVLHAHQETEILTIQPDHPMWEKTIAYARACSWRAGPALAGKMAENGFRDWERVIIAVLDGHIAGFCTLAEKDELPDRYPYSPFIGFVFVDEIYRGRRLAGQMIGQAARYAGTLGFQEVYVMSGEQGLYEKYGFEKTGDYETIYGTTEQLFRRALPETR